jgi:hypothetical protein
MDALTLQAAANASPVEKKEEPPIFRSRSSLGLGNVIVSRLINPIVPVDFFQIRNRGRKLSAAGEEFTTFLQGYIARWAGRAGVL